MPKLNPVLITVVLSLLGVAGNLLNFPLFFGVNFIFGSVAVLLALRLTGIWAGAVVALLAGFYTYVIWGHPYAMLIFIAEAVVVGLLIKRRFSSLVLADLLFWVLVGMPLIWVFYHGVMDMHETQSLLIVLKQPVNGVSNAIIATFIFYLIPTRFYRQHIQTDKPPIQIKELLFTTVLAITFSITLVLIIYQNHVSRIEYEKNLQGQMELFVDVVQQQINRETQQTDIKEMYKVYHADKYGYEIIILSSDKIMSSSLARQSAQKLLNTGDTKQLNEGLYLWMPERKELPFMLWWQQAYYYIQRPLENSTQRVMLLKNSRAIINKLQADASRTFAILFVLTVLSGIVAFLISNMLTRTVLKLTDTTNDIVKKIQGGMRIQWPNSSIYELQLLSTQAEAMSVQLADTFNDVNKRSTAIIESSADAIITMNRNGSVLSFNAAAERLFGYSRSDIIGRSIRCLLPEPYRSNDMEYTREFVKVRNMTGSGLRRELFGLHKEGRILTIELSLTRIQLHNEIIYSGIITDISERKENERIKQEFISTVSHELRTPLTSLKGAISLIDSNRQKLNSNELDALMALAARNAERLTVLINDLLDFEKLDSDGLDYNMQSVKIDDLIARIIENDAQLAIDANVSLVQSERCHHAILADPDRMTQILSNLVSNAIKFSPEKSVVHLGSQLMDKQIKIYVRDEGSGIPESFRDRIFQRFSQADSSDTKQVQRGTGLGLAIAKGMAKDMGGQIAYENNSPKGSTFYLLFPCLQTS